ncbi:MAG: rhodanese-like domain-containing protein [Candidatus Eutrophobiaceae bacterium]
MKPSKIHHPLATRLMIGALSSFGIHASHSEDANQSAFIEQAKTQGEVRIAPDLRKATVMHAGRPVVIERKQDTGNTINPRYARTSRPCPPFCIQAAHIAPGVDTIAELEVIDTLRRIHVENSNNWLVIDSRTPDWVAYGTIPGSINIPWTRLKPRAGADPFGIADLFEKQFGVFNQEGLWDFSQAKTLILFCNGPWCGQSPNNIRTLLRFGYPAEKIKWYRGGMQAWESLGLTVAK